MLEITVPKTLEHALKRMCYRKVRTSGEVLWIKPVASTLLVIAIIDQDTVKLSQIFGSSDAPLVWKSGTKSISELTEFNHIQQFEIDICRNAYWGTNHDYTTLVPDLDWFERIEDML